MLEAKVINEFWFFCEIQSMLKVMAKVIGKQVIL
jgi:hypothetical protein